MLILVTFAVIFKVLNLGSVVNQSNYFFLLITMLLILLYSSVTISNMQIYIMY